MATTLLQSQSELAETLIKKAFIQLFSKQGIDKITVSKICSVSGVSRSAFYRHFDDKYDILENIETELSPEELASIGTKLLFHSFYHTLPPG